MLQINTKLCFKSISEKHALTFLIPTAFPLVFFYYETKIVGMSDAMCDTITFLPLLRLFSFYQKLFKRKDIL